MSDQPKLVPQNRFPDEAIPRSVEKFDPPTEANFVLTTGGAFTVRIASAADIITAWGTNVRRRDSELRAFWKDEPYLAGATVNVAMRNAALDWEIIGPNNKVVVALTDMLESAMAGDTFGWTNFQLKFNNDLLVQDNGGFVELVRDPSIIAGSRFKDENAPVIAINHLDSNRCQRTGHPVWPVIYHDIEKHKTRKLKWYDIIPFADFPSPIKEMYGVGVCAISRVQRIAQVLRSISVYKDEKITGRNFSDIHIVGGVAKAELEDLERESKERLDNQGRMVYAGPMILASIDPEKPVSTATLPLASLPDQFNIDDEMRWYINALSLGFGVDYQEFAPLAQGGLGSSNQGEVLARKSAGKASMIFMKMFTSGLKNYGVFPAGYKMQYKAVDYEEERQKQEMRTKAAEEYAIVARSGLLSPEAIRADMLARGIYDEEIINLMEKEYGLDIVAPKQMVGDQGGNTLAEDARRTDSGKVNENNRGGRMRKVFSALPWNR